MNNGDLHLSKELSGIVLPWNTNVKKPTTKEIKYLWQGAHKKKQKKRKQKKKRLKKWKKKNNNWEVALNCITTLGSTK